MDASKLRNSCICGNTLPYLECCGRYADPLPETGETSAQVPAGDAETALYHAFRHGLHELSMALFPLRALYQAYWEKLAKEPYPHDQLMEDPEYGRAIIENFFWDHFVQYSDARPILRTARELEGKDLRLAHDMMQWSYSPLWFYRVQERNARTARLINLGNLKAHTVIHDGRLPQAGEGVLTRVLPFRGKEFCGHVVLAFNDGSAPADAAAAARLESLFRAGCRELGVKPSVTLRPDVHCDEWRRHGAVFLGLWRAEAYDATVGRPTRGSGSGHASASAAASAPASAPVLNLALRDREAMLAAMAASPDARATGPGQWDLRFRGMRLARMEAKGGNLSVTMADPAFRAHVRDWIRERLGSAVAVPDDAGAESLPGETPESEDVWVQTPLDVLNGQTPIQASTHDLGRRRLNLLLKDLIKQGRDVVSLKTRLGI